MNLPLCIACRTSQKKRLDAAMARLICAGAEHVIVTVSVVGTGGDGDKRTASTLLLAQEVGKTDAHEMILDRIECAAAAYARAGGGGV